MEPLSQQHEDVLWKQYELQVSLYKEYLNLALKLNMFYYAATGAVISYYFSQAKIPWMKYSLLFPVVMSFGFAAFFLYAAKLVPVVREELFAIRDQLRLLTAPDYAVLSWMLRLSAVLFLVVGVSLLCLMFIPVHA